MNYLRAHISNAVRGIFISLALFVTTSSRGEAQEKKIYIDVGQAQVKKSLLALPSFQFYGNAAQSSHLRAGAEIFNVAFNDLTVSNLFTFISPEAYLEDISKVGLRPSPEAANGFNFKNWSAIGAEFLVRGGYKVVSSKISLEVYVYYVPQAKLVFAKTYEGELTATRTIAHTFANEVVFNLTGKKGMFLTKVVVSSDKGASKGGKEIYVMDWDGNNPKQISNHNSIAISPAWSPDGKKVAYTAYAYHAAQKTRNADLFMYDLANGKRWLVSYRKGMNSGANFLSNDEILVTLSHLGAPDIFRMSLDGKGLSRITNGPGKAMNVEPALSPDGTKIAFSSDRSGGPMIYVMNLDGSNVQRRTWAGKYNATPSWSPDGKKLLFAGFEKSHFDIFLMNADGTDMSRLTSATKQGGRMANNEDPSFSPDGRHILFTSDRTGNYQLYLVSPDGTNERRITFDNNNYYKPRWSPHVD